MDTPQMHCDEPSAAPAVPVSSDASKPCKTCLTQFRSRRRWQEFCSNRCRNEWHGKFARMARIKEAAPDLYEALVAARGAIRGQQIEHTWVNFPEKPELTLGAKLDAALAKAGYKEPKAP